ncbi:hypothetical protein E2542_SST31554 [Spatholobus suberectus]|nr:hypothetical protein E2542_SST31554 [Spatholobus suberectus]
MEDRARGEVFCGELSTARVLGRCGGFAAGIEALRKWAQGEGDLRWASLMIWGFSWDKRQNLQGTNSGWLGDAGSCLVVFDSSRT